jgi:protein tyrosine phosphatase
MIKNTKNESDFRIITHIQTVNWPDYLEPEKETGYTTLEQILILIQESICYNTKSPILVHCR